MQENTEQLWYIIQQEDGTCAIVELDSEAAKKLQQSGRCLWGSLASEQEAIAKRIGLIRAHKCKPQ